MKNKLLFTICASSFIAFGAYAQGTISTIAGTGGYGLAGDGGPAINATFSSPSGVAVDNAGNIFITDRFNSRIRKIDAATGNISTIIGTTFGYLGMNGPASAATIMYPDAIYVDNSGNLLISDWYADAAYRVTNSTGTIANICGHEQQGCSGDGGDGSMATMEVPNGVWGDASGNVFIVDVGNNRIRRVDGATGIVNTIAGGTWGAAASAIPATSAAFNGVSGVCTDAAGNVYISDQGNNCVREIAASTGYIRTIVGTGTAGFTGDGGLGLDATLNMPGHLFMNANGYLFICDQGNNAVRVFNTSTNMITTLAGTGAAGYTGDGGSPTAAQLNSPSATWEDGSGNILIADANNNVIRQITGSGYKHATMAQNLANGSDLNIFPNPSSGAFNVQTNSFANTTVEVYNAVGQKVMSQQLTQQQTSFNLNQPGGVYNIILRSDAGTTSRKITIAK